MFKPESLTVGKLFHDMEVFKVPDYQRSYSWQDEQVEQLWEDIYNSYSDNKNKEDKESYFLGSVVTVKAQKHQKQKYKNYQDIVDGQQRLTTLMILFCVVRDLYPNINEGKEKPSVTKKQLNYRIKDEYDNDRLRTCSEDHSKFTEIILKEDSIKRLEGKPSKKDLSKNKAEDNFKNTAYIFKQKLEGLKEEEERGEIIDYLCNNVTMIMITCESQPFAIKLFQILNDRGLDLTVSDLVKACLMQKISQDKNKREQFKLDWEKVRNMVEGDIDDLTLDDMLTLYVYYHLGKNPKKSTNDEFEDLVKKGTHFPFTEDSTVIINDFKNFCKDYKDNLHHETKDKVIFSLHYLPWKMHCRAILLTALKTKYPYYQELVREIRRFYYIYWIAGYTLHKVKYTSFQIMQGIKSQQNFNEIKEHIDKRIKNDEAKSKAIDSLKGEVDQERWIKPLLLMIHYNLVDESSLSFIKLDKKLHLEHILPQEYKDQWLHITEEVANKYQKSIGNLTLVSGKKNIIASNKSFEEKIKIYKGVLKSTEGITGMEVTRRITEKYQQWDENSIKEHSQWYLEEVDKLLDIGCSKRDGA